MGIFLLVIGLLLTLGGSALSIYYTRAFGKNEKAKAYDKNFLLKVGLGLLGVGIGSGCLAICSSDLSSWHMSGGHMAMAFIGNFFFGAAFILFWLSFYLRFYKKGLEEKDFKYTRIALFSSIVVAFFAFILGGEGLAPYLSYPLFSGFSINGSGFHFYNYLNERQSPYAGGLHIAFYGVVILIGAVIAFKMSDHHMYLKYGRHGILDTVFFIAFPAGILGARIWYVVGNWNGDVGGITPFSERVANGEWWSIFAIWEGGLTILGGAVFGILAGALYVIFRRKYVDLRIAMDLVMPTILVAQAIGRWGNFFNHEVYGTLTMMENWPLLPTWIKYMMATGFTNGSPNLTPISQTIGDVTYTGNMYVPLFLIESIINIIGYFVIYYAVRNIWRKSRAYGSLSMFYLIWYGITRIIMEPLRDPHYNMGTSGNWSLWNSLIYIILGAAGIVFFQLFAYIRKKKGLPEEIVRGQAKAKVATAPKKEKKVEQKDILSAPKIQKKQEEEE